MPGAIIENVELFYAGTHTDSQGREQPYTNDDVFTIAALYNQAKASGVWEAPAVKGHPADNDPAYGWVSRLKAKLVDGVARLYGDFENVAEDFVQELRDRRYKNRSISLYDNLLLRHVGFLGAVPPALKGLAPIPGFQEAGSESWHLFTFAEPNPTNPTETMDPQQIADALAAIQTTLDGLPAAIATAVAEAMKKDEGGSTEGDGAGGGSTEGDGQQFSDPIAAQTIQTLQAQLQTITEKQLEKEVKDFLEGEVADRVSPAMLPSFRDAYLAAVKKGEGVSFAEGQKTPLQEFQEKVRSLPRFAGFSEIATGRTATDIPADKAKAAGAAIAGALK